MSDTCRPGTSDDKSYYYTISDLSSDRALIQYKNYNYRLRFVTGDKMDKENVFIYAIHKDIKRLNRMGYKTKCDKFGDHIIDISIKNKY